MHIPHCTLHVAESAQALLQARSQERAPVVTARTFGIVRLPRVREPLENSLNIEDRYFSVLYTPVVLNIGTIQAGRKLTTSALMTEDA